MPAPAISNKRPRLQKQAEDVDFELLEDEDEVYHDAVSRVTRDLDLGVPVQAIDRSFIPNYDFSMSRAVVVLGQDGLVANAAKYVGDAPIIGVNPDPTRFDGVLLPFQLADARNALRTVLAGKDRIRTVDARRGETAGRPADAGVQRSLHRCAKPRLGSLQDHSARPHGNAFVERRVDFDGCGVHWLDVVGLQHGGRNRDSAGSETDRVAAAELGR